MARLATTAVPHVYMRRSFASVASVAVLTALLLAVVTSIAVSLLGSQTVSVCRDRRQVRAVFVAIAAFERIQALTPRQRLLWKYTISVQPHGGDYEITFHPRQPNPVTREDTDRQRSAWETHILVSQRSFRILRWYLAAD